MKKEIDRIPKPLFEKMLKYPWPGNVRELEHLIERGVIISSGNSLALNEHCLIASPVDPVNGTTKDLKSLERNHILEVLSQTNWKIEGPGGAASILNIHPSTLRFKLKKLGIKRPA